MQLLFLEEQSDAWWFQQLRKMKNKNDGDHCVDFVTAVSGQVTVSS